MPTPPDPPAAASAPEPSPPRGFLVRVPFTPSRNNAQVVWAIPAVGIEVHRFVPGDYHLSFDKDKNELTIRPREPQTTPRSLRGRARSAPPSTPPPTKDGG